MRIYTHKTYIIVSGLLLIALSLAAGFYVYNKNIDSFKPHAELQKINQTDTIPDYLEIEKIVADAMKAHGTKAGFEVIDAGEELGLINNDACHGFLHYVGHAAYAQYKNDYENLLSIAGATDCIGAYLHGIEAEIVLASDNLVEEVRGFCAFQKEKGVNPGPCYHGVGHATTELYDYDVQKSLALCDALRSSEETDLSNCYRGIFSEVGNAATGNDGHTGLSTEIRAVQNLDPQKPFTYCESFDTKYQSSCKSQLLKVAQMNMHMDEWLEVCLDPALAENSQNICVNISTGVYVRHHLSFVESVTPPPLFEKLPVSQQKIGILGSAEAFSGYTIDNKTKDWRAFCNSIENQEVSLYCSEIFTRIETRGDAPWMERTDIR